jgi:hypothetical protein
MNNKQIYRVLRHCNSRRYILRSNHQRNVNNTISQNIHAATFYVPLYLLREKFKKNK